MRTKHLRRTILEMLANENKELHGYAVHRRLLSLDIRVQLSRLYGVLHEMLRDGLLEDRWERSRSGPKKRVYKLTRLGRENLNNLLPEGTRIALTDKPNGEDNHEHRFK